jgi:hypothetical protein
MNAVFKRAASCACGTPHTLARTRRWAEPGCHLWLRERAMTLALRGSGRAMIVA